MALIDEEQAATRLARAICADIELYNADAVRSGADLTGAVAEGRELFLSRVTPRLHGLFEATLAARPLGALDRAPRAVASAGAPADRPARRTMSDAYVPTESERRGSSAPILALVGLVVMIALGALVWLRGFR